MMNKKNLSEYATLAEIISGVAVVVSLIFVILGMQRNTDAVNSATLQAATDSSNDFLLTVIDNPELRRIMSEGHFSYSSLSDDDLNTYRLMMRNRWVRFQSNFSQWKRGVLDDGDWDFYQRLICNVPKDHGTVLSWSEHTPVLSDEFIAQIETCSAFNGT